MKIGTIAKLVGVSRDTIRLYEKMGMLVDITQPYKYNNYKEYSEKNIERVKMIITMKGLGLTLKECKDVIQAIDDNKYENNFQNEFIKNKLTEIDKRIAELIKMKKVLEKYIKEGCDNSQLINQIKNK